MMKSSKIKRNGLIAFTILGMLATSYFGFGGLSDPSNLLPGMSDNQIAHTYAGYVAARVIGLWLFFAVVIIKRDLQGFGWFMLINGFIQSADAVFGIQQGLARTLGPAIFAVGFLLGAVYLLRIGRNEGRK
jgi:hypothetical protein